MSGGTATADTGSSARRTGPAGFRFRDMISALYRDTPGRIDLRVIRLGRKGLIARAFVDTTDTAAIAEFCLAHLDDELYFGVALRGAADDGSLDGCVALTALFVDLDFKQTPEAECRFNLARCPVQPSVVVGSGGGLHAYWPLTEAIVLPADAGLAGSLLRRLTAYLGADPSSAEPAHILRVPGSSNHKYNPARAVTIESLEPDRCYNLSDFDWLPSEPAQERPHASGPAAAGKFGPGKRHAALFATGRSLKWRGATADVVLAALLAMNREQCEPQHSETTVREIVDNVMHQKDRSDCPPRPEPDAEPDAGADRPVIDATDQDLSRVTEAAIAALGAFNEPPSLFTFGGLVGRLDTAESGAPAIVKLDEHRCRRALALAANWQRRLRNGTRAAAFPPVPVVRNVLASPVADLGLPVLHRIIEAPMFDQAGRLHLTPGYSPDSQMFYAPAAELVVPDVPDSPTVEETVEARDLLLDDLLHDFPFTSDAERAHALSVVVLPFVREMIEGPTPLHLFEKPTPGTGATLLVTALLWPAIGRDAAVMTEGTDEESWRKRITSTLCGSPTAVLIDNLRRRLDSAALSSAITATTWEDRILGRTENIRIPVRCVWLATGNNPALSNEISRRTIRIRLDAHIDRPWLRSGFKHDPLLGWAREERPRLIWACLTLIQRWIADGRPPGRVVMGQFESWSRVLGGVLDSAAVPGFLGNLDEFYDLADSESAGWRGLVERWSDRHGTAAVGVSDLWRLVSPPEDGSGLEPLPFDFLDDAKATDRSLRTRFGKRLAGQRDRVYGGFRITSVDRKQGAAQWRLAPTS